MNLPSKRVFFVVAAVYLLASLVHAPIDAEELEGIPHIRLGRLAVAPPMVLSGDSPHYLVAVNSLIEDGDFDLANNYTQANKGDWDMGARFRGKEIDRHVDVDRHGKQIGTHSPFFVLLLAPFTAPVRGTQWVPVICIWLTLATGLLGLWLYGKWLCKLQVDHCQTVTSLLLLAFATPLLCYSRDIWTEPYVLAVSMAMLISTNLWILALLGFTGTLLKYPFVVVPMTMGVVALHRRQLRRAGFLIGSSVVSLLVVIGTIQWLFQDVDHLSLFHSGRHRGFDLPFDGMVGLLFGPETGLFLFFPFLAWCLLRTPRAREVYLPALVFFFVHAAYQGWHGGTGFSARYLVPVLPILTMAVAAAGHRTVLFGIAVLYSLFWGLFGGFFPALVYDRSPWDVVLHVWNHM
jgi:hypothetical protein